MRAAATLAALLLWLAACTAPPAEPAVEVAEDAAPAEAGVETGRVLAFRPLVPLPAARGRAAEPFLVLAAGSEAGGAALALEVLVRVERTGRDVALFHPTDPALQIGDRVAIAWEPRPRLRRLAGG